MKKILSLLIITSFIFKATSQNVGIGTNAPKARFSVGSNSQFQVDALGDIRRINDIPYSFPVIQGASGEVLVNDGTGQLYWGEGGKSWNINGNAGTDSNINFIGTSDAHPLVIKTNNLIRARISQKGQIEIFNTGNSIFIGEGAGANDDLTNNRNVFIGNQAGFANTTGVLNTAIGYLALQSNTDGGRNTAIGYIALNSNTTGDYNSAVGFGSLNGNMTGRNNSALGYNSLYSNTEGNYNTAIGDHALQANTSGDENSAFGYNTLYSNTTGSNNVALGQGCLYDNLSGYANTAIGYGALHENINGNENIAIGNSALEWNISGKNNIAIGSSTLATNTTGTYNTCIGSNSDIDGTNRTNTVILSGKGALALGGDNRIRLGNSSITSIGGQVGWTTISDKRVKSNVLSNVKGLQFIMKLSPITYSYNIAQSLKIQHKTDAEDWKGKYDIEKIRFSGFFAQDVEKVAKEIGYDFSGVDKPEDSNGLYGLRYADFVAPLVKAVQEQQEQIEALKAQIYLLQRQMESFTATKKLNNSDPN